MYDELYKCKDKTKLNMGFLLEKYGIFNDESILAHDETELPVEKIFIAGLAITPETESPIVGIKNEVVTVLEQVDKTSQANSKEDAEFHDPISEEMQHNGKTSCTTTDSEGSSSCDNNYSEDDADSSKHTKKHLKKTSEDAEEQTCNICSQIFHRRSNYSTHMKKKHGVKVRKSFNCSQCEQKFEKKCILSKHVRDVHRKPVGKFVCEACGEAMVTKRELTLHMLKHTDFIPFKCKDCGKCFKGKYHFNRHCEIHRDKVICPICGKQLSCEATFKNHMLVHSDKMNHKCDFCGREFKRAKGLKGHLLLHSGLKPYSCEFCERTFDNRSNCRFHMKLKHPNEFTELEASGQKTYTSVPRLDELKSLRSEYLKPVNLKRGGGKLTSKLGNSVKCQNYARA